MNYILASKESKELEAIYVELCSYKELCEEDKELKQDVLEILVNRGWRV